MSQRSSAAKLAFVFPGQGAQAVGMMGALAQEFSNVAQRFERASHVLGFDLWELVCNGPEDTLNRTQNTQPALLAASVATWDIWLAAGGPLPQIMAGHSFGEYSALVCAGALDYETAIALVADRGRYMQEAVPEGHGAMAAILGLDAEQVAQACAQAASGSDVCACANLNAPGQIVIAGTLAAVERACTIASELGAKRAIKLPVSVPAHCDLMRPAAERLAQRLADVKFDSPAISVVHNVDVASHADADHIKHALVQQLYSPVRWIETVESFAAAGIVHVVECGPAKVLSALVKRIDRTLQTGALNEAEDAGELIAKLEQDAA